MIEQVSKMVQNNTHTIEKVIAYENVNYNHMILNKNEGLSEHFSNSNVYMTVIRGVLSIGLCGQEIHEYSAVTVLKMLNGIKMNVKNLRGNTLKLLVVKAPTSEK